MPTHTRTCPMCSQLIPDDAPMTRQQVHHQHGRLHWKAWEPICLGCIERDDQGRVMGYVRGRDPRRSSYIDPCGLDVDPQPCATCGLPVMVAPDKRRKVVTCSDLCRSRHYSHHAERVTPTEHACDECGVPMTGRADRRYCSAACRQRAYRSRARVTD